MHMIPYGLGILRMPRGSEAKTRSLHVRVPQPSAAMLSLPSYLLPLRPDDLRYTISLT